MLLFCAVAVYSCAILLLCCYAIALCAVVLLCYHAVVLLLCCVVMLCYHAVVLLLCCVVMLLFCSAAIHFCVCYSTAVLLCYTQDEGKEEEKKEKDGVCKENKNPTNDVGKKCVVERRLSV
jgi:membrane protein implicated in regulation of membrane protease activity